MNDENKIISLEEIKKRIIDSIKEEGLLSFDLEDWRDSTLAIIEELDKLRNNIRYLTAPTNNTELVQYFEQLKQKLIRGVKE